jgi:hypothetical protein
MDSIYIGPGEIKQGKPSLEHCFGKWIKTDQLLISLLEGANDETYKMYSNSNLKAKFQKVNKEFYKGSILSVKNGWAKVSVKTNSGDIKGWIPRSQQCGIPWTTCNNDF